MRKIYYINIDLKKNCLFKIIACLYSTLIITQTFAQQFNNWVFLNNNGLNFSTSPPVFFGGIQISNTLGGYSCASISNTNGQLLFYSDGERVWNKNNQLMPNGFGLFGGDGQINTALIIPFINDSNKYYLFTSKGLSFTNLPDTCKYHYSVIDMQANGGLGDVLTKNVFIKFFATERMVAISNANGNDIWWICRDWTNNFYSYKITCIGFQNSNPIISTTGTNTNNNQLLITGGDIKASTDGKLIAVCYKEYFELYRFNNATGIINNPIKIPVAGCYGVEFSPDSKLLYITQNFQDIDFPRQQIAQYDLGIYDSTLIKNSVIRISQPLVPNGYGQGGGLQLGPDNKIYHSRFDETLVDVINNPNGIGNSCGFQLGGIVLPNPTQRRFPYSYVNLITAQNVQITYTVAADCRTVTFNAKTYIKGNNLTFKWKWGEPPPVAGTAADSATQVVPSGGATTYTTITHTYPPGIDTFFVGLTVNSDTLCGTGRAGARVVVKPPKPTANFGFATTCNSLNVAFTDSSLLNFNPSLSYQYAFKQALAPPIAYNNFSTAPNNNYTFAAYDSFDVRLIVRSPLSCVQGDTIVKRIVLKAKPTAGSSYTNTCGSLAVNVTNSSSIAAGTITSYRYFVGNTLIASTPAFSYNFAAYGSYTIKQVAQSNFGCVSDTFFLSVVVKDKPVTTLSFVNDSLCANTNFTLTSNAGVKAATVTNYFWQINNGAVQNLPTNTRTDNLPTGIYNYKHWVRSSHACESDTVYQTITVVSKPTSTLTATNNCGSRQININSSTNVINDNITTYYVDYGDGNTSNANPNNTTYTYSNYGSYTIKYLAKSSVGCAADTVFFLIVVKDKPVATIGYNNDACQNTNFVLTATATVAASNINNYTWIRNGVVLTTTTNQLTQNQPAGTYEYKLVARAANGCSSDTVTQNVIVEQYPTTAFTAAGGCVGNNIVITNNSTSNNAVGSLTYVWATNDGQASTAVVPAFSFAASGPKTITLTTTTPNGCATPLTQNITVDAFPTAAFDITEACLGKPLAITNNSTGNISNYTWQVVNGGQTSSAVTPSFTFNNEGNYSIKLEVATPNNCSNAISKNTSIRAVRLFTTPAIDTNVAVNQPLQLNIIGAATYLWSPGSNLSSIIVSSTTFKAVTAGIYPLQIEGTTAAGCKGNASLTVKVFANGTYVWIPGAFTPNGDNLNDRLRIVCSGLKALTGFTIYNRYGQPVYHQTTCNSNGWNGFFNGLLQPTGSFVYKWQGIDFNGKIVSGKGSVVLVR